MQKNEIRSLPTPHYSNAPMPLFKNGARGPGCTSTGDALDGVSLLLEYASGQKWIDGFWDWRTAELQELASPFEIEASGSEPAFSNIKCLYAS